MFSSRFSRPIVLNKHAQERMLERNVTIERVVEIVDTGETKFADATHLWAYKAFPNRDDNLICAVLVLEDKVVVKTIMHHFEVLL